MDNCRICTSTRTERFTANGFDWLTCAECHAITKVLTPDEYRALNPTYDPGNYLDSRNRSEIEAILDVRTKVNLISTISKSRLRTLNSRLAFLDVGSGMGGYLLAAQRLQFDVLGIEPSFDHARVAREILHLPVIGDYFTPEKLDGQKFDFIMLSHVIEHIYKPKEFLHSLIDLLYPGGVLVVVTPNSESLIASIAGSHWAMLKPTDHVSMISAKAYPHFDLADLTEIHHEWSEYPWEFVASIISSSKTFLKSAHHAANPLKPPTAALVSAPTLRDTGLPTSTLKGAMALLSLPMHLLAILLKRQATLLSVLVRKH